MHFFLGGVDGVEPVVRKLAKRRAKMMVELHWALHDEFEREKIRCVSIMI